MTPEVINKHHKRNVDGIKIMRGTIWGNPFVIGKHGKREEVIAKYKQWLYSSRPDLVRRAKTELKGQNLLCCCKPAPCHGDILLEIANED